MNECIVNDNVCLRKKCMEVIVSVYIIFFLSSRRRHTRCALVTGVQTCALPIFNPACSSPPWREIFAADAERKQDFAEAQATYQAMVAVYSGLGYELVTLPLASVAERVRFVRAAIEREES